MGYKETRIEAGPPPSLLWSSAVKHWIFSCAFLAAAGLVHAAVIKVPSQQPTIQDAINAAKNGDVVVVAPGTYFENINFEGKAILVESSSGSKATIIDGGNANSVVTFNNGEGLNSVLHGFTIQHGNAGLEGGGVSVSSASPKITGNIITNNTACADGGGVSLVSSAALLEGNIISNNYSSECTGPFGGGLSVEGSAAMGGPQIIGNVIENNTTASYGAGVELNGAGSTLLQNNIIHGNTSSSGQGGGVWIVNETNVVMVQNLIYNNSAAQGSGIYLSLPFDGHNLVLVNNTIVGTASSLLGSAVWAGGFDDQVQFFNNLMIGASGTNAVDCDSTYDQTPPTFTNNDAYSPSGSGLQGTCSAQSGSNGNISANPTFAAGTVNFHLKKGSPAIDAGDNSAPDIPPLDLAGKARIVDGNGDGKAVIDMGAYEYQPPQ